MRWIVAALARLMKHAPVVAALAIAVLCVEVSIADDGSLMHADDASSEGEPLGSDSPESPDASDDLNADLPVVIAPAATRAVVLFNKRELARSGVRSRIPRPSGR